MKGGRILIRAALQRRSTSETKSLARAQARPPFLERIG